MRLNLAPVAHFQYQDLQQRLNRNANYQRDMRQASRDLYNMVPVSSDYIHGLRSRLDVLQEATQVCYGWDGFEF